MIYVPPGWAYIANTKDGKSVTVAEARMTSNAIEEAAGAMGEQEIHGLKRGLENPLWITWRRFTEILKQRKRAKK